MMIEGYTPEQAEFLKYIDEIGAVLSTCIFYGTDAGTVYERSKATLLPAMASIGSKYEFDLRKNISIIEKQSINIEYLLIKPIPGKTPIATEISLEELVGVGYDINTKTAILFDYRGWGTENDSLALAYALVNTPHGLRHTHKGELGSEEYEQYEREFFSKTIGDYLSIILNIHSGTDAQYLTIYSWTTDWSTYFEDGYEWWGAYCWTVHDARNNTIIFIAAATTD